MSLTVLCGGQVGSEGKGKIVAYLTKNMDYVVRTGGANAGHTIHNNDDKIVLHMLPCGILNTSCKLMLGAATYINKRILLREIDQYNIQEKNLVIDNNATIISDKHIEAEELLFEDKLSTGSGVGAATSRRVLRDPDLKLASDIRELQPFCGEVWQILNNAIDDNKKILIEGVQGMDLSLYHGSYPYVTSRDVSPGTLLGDVGVSPRLVDEIIMVLRTYPIRSCNGPLCNETSWDAIKKDAGINHEMKEMSTVTKRVRRVGEFDDAQVEKAIKICRPTQIALTFLDYINYDDYKKSKYTDLSKKSKDFIKRIEQRYQVPVTLIGTGPDINDIIDLRGNKYA